jgi:hypothetical protein
VNEEMEKLLMIWINERQMAGDTMTQEMIRSKPRMIYENLKKNCGRTKYSRGRGRIQMKQRMV